MPKKGGRTTGSKPSRRRRRPAPDPKSAPNPIFGSSGTARKVGKAAAAAQKKAAKPKTPDANTRHRQAVAERAIGRKQAEILAEKRGLRHAPQLGKKAQAILGPGDRKETTKRMSRKSPAKKRTTKKRGK